MYKFLNDNGHFAFLSLPLGA